MRLIDVECLCKSIEKTLRWAEENNHRKIYNCICDIFIPTIVAQPTVDAQPVIHGHWEPFEKEAYWFQDIEEIWETGKPTKCTQYRCSHCLTEFGTIVVEHNYIYCPICGAKMDRVR